MLREAEVCAAGLLVGKPCRERGLVVRNRLLLEPERVVHPGGLDRHLGIVGEFLAQLEEQGQRLLELARLAEGDRLCEPIVRAHEIGFSIATHSSATPSGRVTSNSSVGSKPYAT